MSITVKDGSGADVVLDPATSAKQDTANTSLATVAALAKAEDAAHASGDPGVMLLAVRKDTAAALAGTDGDYIPLIVDSSGRIHVAPISGAATAAKQPALGTAGTPSADVISVQGVSGGTAVPTARSLPTTALSTRVAINAASSGDNTLVAAVVGQTIRVHKLFFIASGTVNIKFKDGAGSDLTPDMPLYAGGGVTLDFDGDPWFVTTAGNAFVLYLSAAVQISGRIYYSQS